MDLNKQQKLEPDSKAMQEINSTGNLNKAEGATMFSKLNKSKLNKFKSAIKYGTEPTLNLSSNLIGSYNDRPSSTWGKNILATSGPIPLSLDKISVFLLFVLQRLITTEYQQFLPT